MGGITTKVALVLFLSSLIMVIASASVDNGYGKPQYDTTPKPVIPKVEQDAYKKSGPKIPTKPVISKNEHEGYEKSNPTVPSKPVLPEVGHGAYEKNSPKMPTKPVVSKEEHEGYEKRNPTVPSKPVIPEVKHEVYEKNNPKVPGKPVVPKEEHEGYGKGNPKIPTKPVIPKVEQGSYKKSSPKTPMKPAGYEKSNPTIPSKPVVPNKEYGGYDKSNPKNLTTGKPWTPKVKGYPKNIAVQGLIYCKYGPKLIPLKGATTRVTCLAVHKNGYESAPFSFSSCPADEKGYFFAKISSSKLVKDDLWEVVECKAFLENSPWNYCKVPEDTNGGISGAHLTFSRILNGYSLSSVGPFIYNTGNQLSPKEGY